MTKMSFRIRNLLLALAVAAGAAGAAAGPALAADWHHRDRQERYWRYHQPRRYHQPPPVVYGAPYNYMVAPPPVVVAAPVPSFNLMVPLTIR